ncbi:MAG: thioredoxin domain-containing protein, partial [Acidobacteriota bacterium]
GSVSRRLTLLVLAAAAAAWSAYLWLELIDARQGGEAFCAFGGGCDALWDGAFASWIQRVTGLPVAAWGVVWGGAALLVTALRSFRDRDDKVSMALRTASLVIASAGIASLGVLVAASVAANALCGSCIVTYIFVLAWVVVALFDFVRDRRKTPGSSYVHGTALAAGATAAVFLMLLIPGRNTPMSTSALADASFTAVSGDVLGEASDATSNDPERDQQLIQFLASLELEAAQLVSRSLEVMRTATPVPVEPPRALLYEDDAPVRITTFTDARCSHCAGLHRDLDVIRGLPGGANFSLEARHYPLDGNCNANLQAHGSEESASCTAARAEICAESLDDATRGQLVGAIYAKQQGLVPADVMQIASPVVTNLESCLAAPATAAILLDDIAWATRHDIRGTPMVLINGRKGTAFGPFLYAMVLAGGDLDHRAFAMLPDPPPAEG